MDEDGGRARHPSPRAALSRARRRAGRCPGRRCRAGRGRGAGTRAGWRRRTAPGGLEVAHRPRLPAGEQADPDADERPTEWTRARARARRRSRRSSASVTSVVTPVTKPALTVVTQPCRTPATIGGHGQIDQQAGLHRSAGQQTATRKASPTGIQRRLCARASHSSDDDDAAITHEATSSGAASVAASSPSTVPDDQREGERPRRGGDPPRRQRRRRRVCPVGRAHRRITCC